MAAGSRLGGWEPAATRRGRGLECATADWTEERAFALGRESPIMPSAHSYRLPQKGCRFFYAVRAICSQSIYGNLRSAAQRARKAEVITKTKGRLAAAPAVVGKCVEPYAANAGLRALR
jgi:hypothetical protein